MDAVDSKLITREFVCGGVAGAIGVFVGSPFDLLKVKIQTNPILYPSAIASLRSVLKADGYAGLFTGCIPPTCMQGVINSLKFTGEGAATKLLEPDLQPGQSAGPLNSFLAGSCGGLLQCTVLLPADVIKCTMQAGSFSNNGGAFAQTAEVARMIYRAEGIAGFYKGALVTVLREIPSIGMYFFSYKTLRASVASRVEKRDPTVHGFSTPNILFSGAIAGALAWMAIYPIDVVKTNMQSSLQAAGSVPQPGEVVYSKMMPWSVARHLYAKNGAKVFYRGIGTTILRALPVNALIFFVYESLSENFNLVAENGYQNAYIS
ncbi:mitochondrial carrier domain-containing protein [Ochromonadaceae sp. CCMP2298]|nr:mitochondrial carrier domain-containing protein [Ochromonadaceae sp. CCMP2298]|mmetsp:Transcript_5988/g.13237  ORF Transcript_5988/g.13237 Transcript_5988/m.13237 type:complete len:319 (+) Transcript_5988:151-1107(+)|eukprot:CAMPEP_0173239822 /NCGR_PEP_ID=MMETSP1142-20121109/13428_1 /TAXON_ID=483371 /ORGANISM="non described non described, Strain CCMP2298" /LENGTH=318 /DNA_ID=CAMNT_0014170883 /DNA_START=26 /DNA_END=982 /DNA_ORIENTATION=+